MSFDSILLSVIFFSGWILMIISLARELIYSVKHLDGLIDALFEKEYNEYAYELLKVQTIFSGISRWERIRLEHRILKMDIPEEHSKVKYYQKYLKITVVLQLLSVIICFPVFLSAFILIAVFF